MVHVIQVKVLRSMRPLQLEDIVLGQYKGHSKGAKSYPAYTDDPTVPNGSITPTFSAAALFIDNARWDGVPFLMKAGKALHTKRSLDCYFLHSDIFSGIYPDNHKIIGDFVLLELQGRDQGPVQTCPRKFVQKELWS